MKKRGMKKDAKPETLAEEIAKYHVDFDEKAIRSHYRMGSVVAPTVGVLFRALTKIKVEGLDKLPQGPAITVVYHANYLDPLLVGLMLWRQGHMPHFMAKSSLFSGILGWGLKALGQIPVLRQSAKASDSLLYAKRVLDAGEYVVIYPQGTLTKDPDLWPGPSKSGAARLALETGAPLIPIAHWGLENSMPRGTKIPRIRPRNVSTIVIGDPIDYRDLLSDADAAKISRTEAGTPPRGGAGLDNAAGAASAAGLDSAAGTPLHRTQVNTDAIRALTDRITSCLAALVSRASGRGIPTRFTTHLPKDYS